MTTIAWDGTSLAGDRLRSFNGTPVPATKVFRIGRLLVGCAGDSEDCVSFIAWIAAGMDQKAPPKMESLDALVIDGDNKNQVFWYSQRCIPLPLEVKQWALGSGADYALGAMHAGANAHRAVTIACGLDVNSGLGVDVVEMKGVVADEQ